MNHIATSHRLTADAADPTATWVVAGWCGHNNLKAVSGTRNGVTSLSYLQVKPLVDQLTVTMQQQRLQVRVGVPEQKLSHKR